MKFTQQSLYVPPFIVYAFITGSVLTQGIK